MVAMVVMGNSGGLFVGNLSLLIVCFALAAAVHTAAPVVHAMRGWQKVGANVAMTLATVLALAWFSAPQLVQAKALVMMECMCYWGWESWCCWV